MANLIITIIGIALVAVAAIMGVYYGGVAFENGQASAYADKLLSDSQQIAAAYQLYSLDNGGTNATPPTTLDTTSETWTFDFLATPKYAVNAPHYLDQVPSIPSDVYDAAGMTHGEFPWDNAGDYNPLTEISKGNNPYQCGTLSYQFYNNGLMCFNPSQNNSSQNNSNGASNILGPNSIVQPPIFVFAPLKGNTLGAATCQAIADRARGKGADITQTTYDMTNSTLPFDCSVDTSGQLSPAPYLFAYWIM